MNCTVWNLLACDQSLLLHKIDRQEQTRKHDKDVIRTEWSKQTTIQVKGNLPLYMQM